MTILLIEIYILVTEGGTGVVKLIKGEWNICSDYALTMLIEESSNSIK